MKTSNLLQFTLNKEYTHSILKKLLGKDLDEALNNGYFIKTEEKDGQPMYLFTEKGKQAAWEKK